MFVPDGCTVERIFLRALLTLVDQIRTKSGPHQSHFIVMCESDTVQVANAFLVALFAANASAHFIRFDQNADPEPLINLNSTILQRQNDSIVTAFFDNLDLYLDIVANIPKLRVMQTVLIKRAALKSTILFLGAGFTLAPRLLLVSTIPNITDLAPTSPLDSLNFHVWSIDTPTVAIPLTHSQLLAPHENSAAEIFWNDVRSLNGPLEFIADLLPIKHIRQCPDEQRCFALGMHVMLANMLAARLRTVPKIEFKRSFVPNYYESTPYRNDFAKYANVRDALLTFNADDSVTTVNTVKGIRISKSEGDTIAFDVVDLQLIVPYRRRLPHCGMEMRTLVKRLGIFGVWMAVVLVLSCLRYADSGRSDFAAIMLNTWAQSIGNAAKRILFAWSMSQRIVVGLLATIAIIGGSYISGELYQNRFRCPVLPQIETGPELFMEKDVHVYLPIESFPLLVK